jgi:hypothetical protein
MDALCKPRFFATRIGAAFDRALHSRQPLSTASSAHAVHTVGKAGRNSNIFTGLPAFHFASVQFSKTGRVFIHAIRLVSGLLSTFPASTVTTTNKEYIFKAFYSSRDLCRPPDFLWSWLALANFMRLSSMKAEHAAVSCGAYRKSGSRCFYFRPGIHRNNALKILMRLGSGVE